MTGDMTPSDIAGQAVCAATNRDFGKIFRRQYFMTRQPGMCPDGWTERVFGGWHLCHCPDLPVADIVDGAGQAAGWLIGIAVTARGTLFNRDPVLSVTAEDPRFWDHAEALIEGWAGRYAVAISDGRDMRLYVDPVCDMAAVYDPQGHVVASSLLLCLHRPMQPNTRMPFKGPVKGLHNYALQQTPDRIARRAMANHYLCLRTFRMIRHFPKGHETLARPAEDLETVCKLVVSRLRGIMAALLDGYDCIIPVTGGNDSRNLLACGFDHLDKAAGFYVYHSGNKASGLDVLLAVELGKAIGIDVQVVDVAAPPYRSQLQGRPARRARWDMVFSSGYQLTGKNPAERLAPTLAPPGDVLIRGNVMELMRANQWKAGDFDNVSVEHGLRKLVVAPEINETVIREWGPDYTAWMDTLPTNAGSRVYDFAFCELLLPNTMGGWLVTQGTHFAMNAFNDRAIIANVISLPPRLRRRNRLNREIIRLACPALAQVSLINEAKKESRWQAEYHDTFSPIYW